MQSIKRNALAILAGLVLVCAGVAITSPAASAQPFRELRLDQVARQQLVDPVVDPRLAQIAQTNENDYVRFVSQPAQYPVQVVRADQVNEVANALPAAIAAGIFAILLRFAGPFAWVLKVARADQMIERYAKGVIDEWLDHNPEWRTTGITVDVKTAWAQAIATNVINYAPAWLIQFLGGKEAIIQKVRNRLPDVLKEAFPALFAVHRS